MAEGKSPWWLVSNAKMKACLFVVFEWVEEGAAGRGNRSFSSSTANTTATVWHIVFRISSICHLPDTMAARRIAPERGVIESPFLFSSYLSFQWERFCFKRKETTPPHRKFEIHDEVLKASIWGCARSLPCHKDRCSIRLRPVFLSKYSIVGDDKHKEN